MTENRKLIIMRTIKNLLLLAFLIITFGSCQKNTTPITTEEFNLADDEAVLEAIFDDAFSSADLAVQMLDGLSKGVDTKAGIIVLADSCPLVTVDFSDEYVRTITIDYGEGCEGFYDRVRSGKVIIEVTGPRREVGSTRTLTFDNYYFNGIKVEGTRLTENLGLNENQNTVFMSSLTGGKLIFPNDTVIEREATHFREFVAGYDTWNIWDDECLITGSASGTNYRGISYSNTITTALHWKRVCHFYVSGVIEISRSGNEAVELDYGNGECDALATLRRGDQEKEITLRWKHRVLR
jgi:hypothetical protein